MGKGKNRIKVIIRIGPYGLDGPSDVYFTDRNVPMQKLYDLSRGEGNVLCFTLTHSDLTPQFAEALKSGSVAKELRKGTHKLFWDLEGMRREEREECPRCGERKGQHAEGCPEAPQSYRDEYERSYHYKRTWPEEQFLMWERQQERLK